MASSRRLCGAQPQRSTAPLSVVKSVYGAVVVEDVERDYTRTENREKIEGNFCYTKV